MSEKRIKKRIKVIAKRVGDVPREFEIVPTLDVLQRMVGGYIETVTLPGKVVVICDDDGRLKGKAHNCVVCGVDFCGDMIFCGVAGDDFGDLPMTFEKFKETYPELWEEGSR